MPEGEDFFAGVLYAGDNGNTNSATLREDEPKKLLDFCLDLPVSQVCGKSSEFIDHTPKWLKNLAVEWFGTNDKLALRVGMVVTIGLLSLVVGLVARRRPLLGVAAIDVFGVVGAIIAAGRPDGEGLSALPPLLGAVAGGGLLWYLIGLVRRGDGARETPVPSRAPPRSLTTTQAPSLASVRAYSRPRPPPAPVTMTTRSCTPGI